MKNKSLFKINLIYFVAITSVAIIFLLGYMGILKNEILTSFLIQIVVMFAIPLLMYSLLMKKSIKETLSDTGLKKISSGMLLISIALGFVLYFINSFVADAFSSIIALFGFESLPTQATTSTLNYGMLLKELILSCILPGICEEFLHRGIMLHAQKKHANTKYCLIISSIIFGLTHLNIRQFFYASILGFLMGYVALVADSIIPSIIIHFMNNFLSNYFYYGAKLNWPLANFFNYVKNIFLNDVFIFITTSSASVIILIMAYNYLTKQLMRERAKRDIQSIISALHMEKLSLIQAQIQFNQVNNLLKYKTIHENNNKSSSLLDKSLLISSIILGGLITISSFIWGII